MLKQIPNMLTILRIPLTILFLYWSFSSEWQWRLIATCCFLLSMITDLLDGIVARRMNAVSKFGAFLDPLADKFLVLSGFFVLMVRPDLEWGFWRLWVIGAVAVIALREIVITILRSYKVRSNKPVITTMWGKSKTFVQMITLIIALLLLNIRDIFDFSVPGIVHLIAVGIIVSALLATISATDYLRSA
jgi:CDP-diacylglycerol--glycerol-3-phosphate 3-phosphatidyltransferase